MKFSTKVLYIAGCVVSALVLICILWFFPLWQSSAYLNRFSPEILQELKPAERVQLEKNAAEIENSNRVTIAQIIGGLALLSGLYFTYLNVRTAQDNLRITEEGKLTERFSKAVELLGSDKLDVRLGGIYALERIARDSQKDHWTVMEVLTAFVRENSPDKPVTESNKAQTLHDQNDSVTTFNDKENTDTKIVKPSEDIQAIMSVIGRRKWKESETKPLNLQNVNLSKLYLSELDLHRANLSEANLSGADLRRADLRRAHLIGANLSGADLSGANLSGANLLLSNLSGANLNGADLSRADLSGADLSRANLSGANLRVADLRVADLRGADLSRADLRGADLSRANLIGANLSGADLSKSDLIEVNFRNANSHKADRYYTIQSFPDTKIQIIQLVEARNYDQALLSPRLKEELENWRGEQSKENEK